MLLQTWCDLSDIGAEDRVNATLSAHTFCGVCVEDRISDHSRLSLFRKELTEKRAMNKLLARVNAQLSPPWC
jgi:IS5 family transposase